MVKDTQTICLSVFDNFIRLALKELTYLPILMFYVFTIVGEFVIQYDVSKS